MPEHIRALLVILALATIIFTFARSQATDMGLHIEFKRRRNLWLLLTTIAFISNSFWIYTVITAALLIFTQQREKNPLALYIFLLFLIPATPVQIPGFGLINYFFALDHTRLISLCILLPAFIALRKKTSTPRFGRFGADKLLISYILLVTLLYLRETTITDTLRQAFYQFTDVFLPYYVASRCLRKITDFKDAMLAFTVTAMILAIIGLFEYTRHWLLYSALANTLGMESGISAYLSRGGSLRASATTGQAIVLGYVISVAIGFYLFLKESMHSRLQKTFGWALLAAGLFAPLSRGPWVGSIVMIGVFITTGRNAVKHLVLLALIGLLSIPLLAIIPGGQKIFNLLPFIGTIEQENITYRERLLDNALIIIQRNPLLGSVDYRNTPEMQSMIQGQGIIDIVNSYLGVALSTGIIGLLLFVTFFATILLGIKKTMRIINDQKHDTCLLGRALLATLVGVLLMITAVSSISVIPIVYWSLAGIGVAYIQMMQNFSASYATRPANETPPAMPNS